jgi:putative transposase
MYSNHTITQAEVHDQAHAVLQTCLKFTDYKRTCPATMLVSLLLFGACQVASLAAVCRRLTGVPSDETARKALKANLPDDQELERRLNAALVDRLPRALRKRQWPVAIDYFAVPYYGKPQEEGQLRRGPAERGTSRYHTYATAFVVRKGYRFTLAATWVQEGETLVTVLQRLLRRIDKLGISVRYLLLDRAFYESDVVRYLQRARRPFLMPVKLRGRTPKDPANSTSAYQFLAWRRSGWSEYTWKDSQGKRASVKICVSRRQYTYRDQRKQQVLLFAYWGFQPATPVGVRESYRKRFGIETSYRQVNQARIPTSSRDPQRRFLYFVLALIIRNIWAWIHLVRLAVRGKVELLTMPFIDMLQAIQNFLLTLYKCIAVFGLKKSASGFT